jgi:hypothetical protein
MTVVGGERVGEGMGGTMVLTGGSGLPVGERCERERGGAADRWGRVVRRGAGVRSWAAWAGEERGGTRARARLGPETAEPRGEGFSFFFFFCFLFHFSIFIFLFLFISFSFESTIC